MTDMQYDNNHWRELITTIISRIGADAFLRLSAAILKEMAEDRNDFNEEWPTSGKEKDEWKHEAVEAMKLKR